MLSSNFKGWGFCSVECDLGFMFPVVTKFSIYTNMLLLNFIYMYIYMHFFFQLVSRCVLEDVSTMTGIKTNQTQIKETNTFIIIVEKPVEQITEIPDDASVYVLTVRNYKLRNVLNYTDNFLLNILPFILFYVQNIPTKLYSS